MKTSAITLIISLALLAACGGGSGGGPEDAVTGLFDALQAGDGETVASCMSRSALAELDTQLDMLKQAPEQGAAQLAAMGIELDAEAIPDMTAHEFAAAMFSSPMIASMMESAEVSIGEVTVDGETARVQVTTTFLDESETHTIDVVKEDGAWKVTEFGMNF